MCIRDSDRTLQAIHLDLSMQDASTWMTQLAWPGSTAGEDIALVAATDGYLVAECTEAEAARTLRLYPAARDRSMMESAFTAAGITCAPVLTVEEVAHSSQVTARQLILERPTSDGYSWIVLGSPLKLRNTPAEVLKAMPKIGAESAMVIKELCLRTAADLSLQDQEETPN